MGGNKKNNKEKEDLMQKHYKLWKALINSHLEGRTEQEQKIVMDQLQKVVEEMQK